MAIDPNSSYRVGFYHPVKDKIKISLKPLTRQKAFQAVKKRYNPNNPNRDFFVAIVPNPSEPEFFARDTQATEKAHKKARARSVSEEESDDDSLSTTEGSGNDSHSNTEESDDSLSSSSGSKPPTPEPTPILPANPAAQAAEIAAKFFPVQENESDNHRQERADAEALFIKYPFTTKDFWSRFHKPTVVETSMFDIWETGKRQAQGPEATRDMVRANIDRMKNGREWELEAIEEQLKD